MSIIAKVKFTNYRQSVTKAMDLIDAAEKLPQKGLNVPRASSVSRAGSPCYKAESELLGHNPRSIEYLTLADGLLGNMNNIKIII